jgi:lipoprotein-releasing system permease protein
VKVEILVAIGLVLVLSAIFFARAFFGQRGRHTDAKAEFVPGTGAPQPWETGEMLALGFRRFGTYGFVLFLSSLLTLLVLAAIGAAIALPLVLGNSGLLGGGGSLPTDPTLLTAQDLHGSLLRPAHGLGYYAGFIGAGVGLLIVATFFQVGLVRMAIAAARGEPPRFATLFSGARRTFPLMATHLLYLLGVLAGTAFFIIPGIVFALASPLAPFYVVDAGMGPIAALKASWDKTEGRYVDLFVVRLLVLAALLLGALGGGIGLCITLPIAAIAYAGAYARLSGTTYTPAPEGAFVAPRFILAGTAGVVFSASVWFATARQAHAHARYTRWETFSQAIAVVSGVILTLSLLSVLLPLILDQLEKGTFASYVAARHVRSQKSGFLTAISILSICGVGVSSCALSSVICVMGGFRQDLERKILGNNATVVVDTESQAPWDGYQDALERVRHTRGVVAATPVVHSEVMIWSASNLAGVVVRGVEPETINQVVDLGKNIEVGKFEYLSDPEKMAHIPADEVIGIGPGGEEYTRGVDLPSASTMANPNDPEEIDPEVRAVVRSEPTYPGIIVGRELAKTLHVYVGDDVTLVSPLGDLGPMGVMPRTKKFRVAAIFYSAMYEYDATQVYTMLDVAQDFFGLPGKINAIDVKVDSADKSDEYIKPVLAAVDRPDLRVRDWRTMNKSLFVALQTERVASFVILSIAIVVASFCIICTLLLMVTEKGKEIAILKAIGASDGSIRRTFTTEGLVIGGIGASFGTATALALCSGLALFGLKLDPDVYYIDKLPIRLDAWDFVIVAVITLAISAISTIYPALAASQLRPVDGLRYE